MQATMSTVCAATDEQLLLHAQHRTTAAQIIHLGSNDDHEQTAVSAAKVHLFMAFLLQAK